MTDSEIESIAEDSDIEQPICFPKENKKARDNAATEMVENTDENVLAESGKTSLETVEECRQVFEVKMSSEVTAGSTVPKTNEGEGQNTIPEDKLSEDSDDSFFGINVAKVFNRNATTTCIAEYMKPKENTINIERKDLQDVDDGDYLESNCESKEKESHVNNAIVDKISAGIPQEAGSVSEDDKGEGNRKVEELPQKCSTSIPHTYGKAGKSRALDEDPFITELDELLSAAEADIEEDAKKREGQNVAVAPRQTTSLMDEEYIPYKPPIAPKKHPKQKLPERKDEVERFFESDWIRKESLEERKECPFKENPTAKPEQPVTTQEEEDCIPCDTNPDILLGRKVKQIYDGILEASNESSKKGKTASTNGTSTGRKSTRAVGCSGISASTSGTNGSRSATTGGCGDDDPNDPTRRPQRQKEPEDKKDEETEQGRHKAAKKALVHKMMRVTDTLLQTGFQGLAKTIFTRRASSQSTGNRENTEESEENLPDESRMEDEMMLRQQLDERETQLTELEQQMTALQSDNASLSQLLGEVKELAAKDAEGHRLQLEGHLNRIEVLQEENDKHRVQTKTLNESLLEWKEKNKALENEKEDLELGKEALQQKVKLKVKEVLEHMAKCETMRKSCQEATTERDALKQKTQKQAKDLAEQRKKIETLTNKLKILDAEKETLEKKCQQDGQNLENKDIDTCKGASQPVCKCTMDASGQKNELQTQNDKLKEKMEMYEAFLEQVKTEKADYVKALEESRENVTMVRKSSDEQIAKLKKDLEGKNLSEADLQKTIKLLEDKIAMLKADYTKALEESRENENMVRTSSDEQIAKLKKDLEGKNLSEGDLQKTIKLLEERIAMLEAERAESLKLIKAIAERIQGNNELEECKKEWHELERELRNKTSAPKSEQADTRRTLLAKVAERFEGRMREFDECLQYRHALQKDVACLKDLRLEQKRELQWMKQEKRKMNEEIKEREIEVKSIRRTSSEMINDLENQLKGREDSALELQEKSTFLSQKVAKFEAEKFESDKKIKALLEALAAKKDKDIASEETKSNEEQSQSDMTLLMKTSQEKIMTLEKELKNRSESEIRLQNNICSLERRIAELNVEKNERESSMKTLLEALNAQKNLEEYAQKKDQVEKQFLQQVEEMQVEFSQLRSAKEDLERQLASGQSQHLGESDKLGTELKNQIDKLSDEKIKTEKMLQEKQSEVVLVKRTSEAKIEDLENQLRSKNLSEEELQEKMQLLQHKILLLEDEKVRHSKSISSMVRCIKAKEELSEAVKAKEEAEKEYNMKLDEMELIVNKLRKEKKKQDCDMELKKKYKDEYERLNHLVKKLKEDIQGYEKHIEELQSIVDGREEENSTEELDEVDLSESIQDLRNRLSTSDAELLQTREVLAAKISSLEVEKAEFESVLTALLNSLEAKENVGHCVEATREADRKMLRQMDEMLEVVQKLRDEKERFERELHSSENIRVVMAMDVEMLQTESSEKISLLEQSLKESFEVEKDLTAEKERMEQELYASENLRAAMARDVEVLQTQSNEKISLLEQSLKGSFETEEDLKERLELMSKELARLEGEKLQADKTLQTMLASLQGREKLEQCLKEQERIERAVKANSTSALKEVDSHEAQSVATLIELLELKEQQLEQSKTKMEEAEKNLKAKELELELRAKDAERQSREFEECLKEKNETFKGLVGEVEQLKANITMVEEEKKGLLQKLDKHNKVSEVCLKYV